MPPKGRWTYELEFKNGWWHWRLYKPMTNNRYLIPSYKGTAWTKRGAKSKMKTIKVREMVRARSFERGSI